jgi:septum formation protein
MLILASASPRRRELLTQAGFEFQIHPAHIPEDPHPNEDPIAYVTRLARQKAEAVYNEIVGTETDPGAPGLAGRGPQRQVFVVGVDETWESTTPNPQSFVVLGADTTVTLDNQILGKPENPQDAARMLRLLSGRTHRVITGVSLVSAHRTETAAEVTAVQFLSLSEAEIQAYIATGEPSDKAGAYAIQGHAARWIPRIEGCYFNVVGLPIALVSTLLNHLL